MDSKDRGVPRRRQFLAGIGGVSGAVAAAPLLLASHTAPAVPAAAQKPLGRIEELPAGYQTLGPGEAAALEHIVSVMCPADALTSNGVDMGLAIFIDRQLAGGFGRGDRLYRQGPWEVNTPQFGYQSPLTPERFFKAGLAEVQAVARRTTGRDFTQLTASEVDALLRDVASGKVEGGDVPLGKWFNELLYPLFTQACFADPIYGGNRDKAFWKVIGYPGLPAFHTRNVVEFRGKAFPAAQTPKSIQDFS
jgi:gluconate 2-dehydrogenase gamma chain